MNIIHFHKPEEENGYLSNWDMSGFILDEKKYCCAEQYLMEQKALLFGDTAIADQIMQCTDQQTMQNLGRMVHNFNDKIWNGSKQVILYRALVAKFDQNIHLAAKLVKTVDAILAECSHSDRIWGIGRGMDDPRADDIATWNGQNLLGFALMQVRDYEYKKVTILMKNAIPDEDD